MRTCALLTGIVILALSQVIKADDVPQTAPTSQPSIVDLSDKQALDADMGKVVQVQGLVSKAQWSPSGRVFLIRFKEGKSTNFQGALFDSKRDAMEKAFNGDLSNAFTGAKIQITGKLQTYREHPEILIDDATQIVILEKGPGNSSQAASATRPSAADDRNERGDSN